MSIHYCMFDRTSNSFIVGKNNEIVPLNQTHVYATELFRNETLPFIFNVSYDSCRLNFTLQCFSQAIRFAKDTGLVTNQKDKIYKIFQHYVLDNKADVGSCISKELQSLGL